MIEENTPLAEATPESALDAPSEPVAEVAPEPEILSVEESIPVAEPVPEMPVEPAPVEPEAVIGEAPSQLPPPSAPAPQPESKPASPAPVPPLTTPPAPKKSSRPRMLEVVRARKAERLEKIVALARERGVLRNDDVQLLLGVSDATATNYLNALVLSARLRRSGHGRGAKYESI